MNQFLEWLKLGGGIAGITALIWKLYESFSAYLHIEVSAIRDENSGRLRIQTAVENTGILGKKLEAAFLLIGPMEEPPEETIRRIVQQYNTRKFETYNEMVSSITEIIKHDPA